MPTLVGVFKGVPPENVTFRLKSEENGQHSRKRMQSIRDRFMQSREGRLYCNGKQILKSQWLTLVVYFCLYKGWCGSLRPSAPWNRSQHLKRVASKTIPAREKGAAQPKSPQEPTQKDLHHFLYLFPLARVQSHDTNRAIKKAENEGEGHRYLVRASRFYHSLKWQ